MKVLTNNQYKALAIAFHNIKEENRKLKEENARLKESNARLSNLFDTEYIDFPNSHKGGENSIWEL
jgi:hypothetical protein